ncbi:uncharacterized protein LOC143174404 [Nomia melanderi]|uniref:uncharacterized protein LOC143174404 n=1 Tax=Nomia melanderi TaxID=2448451 RepID=UPI003FCD54B2
MMYEPLHNQSITVLYTMFDVSIKLDLRPLLCRLQNCLTNGPLHLYLISYVRCTAWQKDNFKELPYLVRFIEGMHKVEIFFDMQGMSGVDYKVESNPDTRFVVESWC